MIENAQRSTVADLRLYALVAIAGSCSLALEVLAPRTLTTMYGATGVVWASAISVTLGGLAVGYYLAAHVSLRRARSGLVLVLLCTGLWASIASRAITWASIFMGSFASLHIVASACVGLLLPSIGFGMIPVLSIALSQRGGNAVWRCAGRVYAASTFGGVVGALATALWLIPSMGVQTSHSIVSAILLVCALLVAQKITFLPLLAIPVLLGAVRPKLAAGDLLNVNSLYQNIRVSESPGGGERYIHLGVSYSAGLQVERNVPLGPFARETIWLCRQANVKSALILGGAGNTIALALEKWGIRTVTVELDPGVVDASAEYFGIPDGPVLISDARVFLQATSDKFDCIIVDVFEGQAIIPAHMVTREFFALVRKRLSGTGIALINIIGATRGRHFVLTQSIGATIATSFEKVGLKAVTPDLKIGNIVIGAGDVLGMDLGFNPISEGGVVATDDLNPIERMMAAMSYDAWSKQMSVGR